MDARNLINWMADMDMHLGDAEIFLHIKDKKLVNQNNLFERRLIHWVDYAKWNKDFSTPINLAKIPSIWSVSELALTIAVYMGFESIYLIGIDHDWFNGVFNYFYDEKTQHKAMPDLQLIPHVDAEFQMRRHAEIFLKYKYLYAMKKNIFNANANPHHYMDVFPKVAFDSLFMD